MKEIREGGKRRLGINPVRLSGKPLISVVTVVLNGGQTLERCIKSVISQTYPSIEYIVVDGGSKDGTMDIIKQYDKAIDYWVSEKDNGLYHAMNKAVLFCTGDYILYLNADDELNNSQTMEKVVNNVTNDIDIFYGNILVEDKYCEEYIQVGREYLLKDIKMEKKPPHPAFFVRSSLLKENPFNEKYRICSDYDLMCRLFMKNLKMKYINETVSIFHTGGLSSRLFRANRENIGIVYLNFGLKITFFYVIRKILRLTNHFLLVFLSRIGIRKKIRRFKRTTNKNY